MRIANVGGRLNLVSAEHRAVDVERLSEGHFSFEPEAIFSRWTEFRHWARAVRFDGARRIVASDCQAVVARPPQVFAIGLNYRDHAREAGLEIPLQPMVFTKFVSSIGGPTGDIALSPGNVDWEVELVVVVGVGGRDIPESSAWDHVAGLTLGQDISDRTTQFATSTPQFSMGKSYSGYSPIGPILVTPDEFPDPDDLEIGCSVNGRDMQRARTSNMIFSVGMLVAKLSTIVSLMPGDLIFTGTPSGVGVARKPPLFLGHGDELVSWCTGIGELRHRFLRTSDIN